MDRKITPFLWFEYNCEEATKFYASVFKGGKIITIKRYPEGPLEGPIKGMEGKVLTCVFELEGQRFMALDGGPYFKFNPSISFIINCSDAEEVDYYWNKLIEGGSALMPLQKYPFSEKYGWLQDKYGVSWQIGVMKSKDKITPSFMFVGESFGKAEEAIKFYTDTFRNSSIESISRYEPGEHDETGKIKFASFFLEGQQFRMMESSLGHKFETTGAISMHMTCENQEEIDYYWDKLTEGGDPSAQQCGWLKDKYGFSWQVDHASLGEFLNDPDPIRSKRSFDAMMKMKKIIVADLEKAYKGEE